MKIKKIVYDKILKSMPIPPPENGGILGQQKGIITEFYRDDNDSSEFIDRYVPNTLKLNKVISKWCENDIYFCGIYHSHYDGDMQLSGGDKKYIETILYQIKTYTDSLYFPLVFPMNDIICYNASLTDQGLVISKEKIILI